MLFEVVTIDMHYTTDRMNGLTEKYKKIKLLQKQSYQKLISK